MANPVIDSISDSSLAASESGVTITGQFGEVEGEIWLYENNNVASPGTTDQITTINSWHDGIIDFDVPGSLNNSGSIYLFVNNLEGWSFGFPVSITAGGEMGATTKGSSGMLNLIRMMG